MNNYINPYSLIKEEFSEATTISQKILAVLIGVWITALGTLAITGSLFVLFQLITNPSQFNDVTWGIFDTLG